MDPLSITASIIAIIGAVKEIYSNIKAIAELPAAFEAAIKQFAIVEAILEEAKFRLEADAQPTEKQKEELGKILTPCEEKSAELKRILEKLRDKCVPTDKKLEWWNLKSTYRKAVGGKKINRVENLVRDLVKAVQLLALNQVFKVATSEELKVFKKKTEEAINILDAVEPSLPDSEFERSSTINAEMCISKGGTGQQVNSQGDNNTFNSARNMTTGTGHTFNYGARRLAK